LVFQSLDVSFVDVTRRSDRGVTSGERPPRLPPCVADALRSSVILRAGSDRIVRMKPPDGRVDRRHQFSCVVIVQNGTLKILSGARLQFRHCQPDDSAMCQLLHPMVT
jgi:hypothetical protein